MSDDYTPPDTGYLYIATREDGGIKLGISGNPWHRMSGLRAKTGQIHTLIACMPFRTRDERMLHLRLEMTQRLVGVETYAPSEFMSALVNRICEMGERINRLQPGRRGLVQCAERCDGKRPDDLRVVCDGMMREFVESISPRSIPQQCGAA